MKNCPYKNYNMEFLSIKAKTIFFVENIKNK